MPANTQTDLAVGLEAPGRREEPEGGRAQRISGGQDDAAVVEARVVGRRRGRAAQGEVPFEKVEFEGRGGVVGGGEGGELGGFLEDALDGWVFGVEGAGG